MAFPRTAGRRSGERRKRGIFAAPRLKETLSCRGHAILRSLRGFSSPGERAGKCPPGIAETAGTDTLALPSHRKQSNLGLCGYFMAGLGVLSYMK